LGRPKPRASWAGDVTINVTGGGGGGCTRGNLHARVQIKLQFMWSHAFVPKKKVAMPMIKYERAAVLFNLVRKRVHSDR